MIRAGTGMFAVVVLAGAAPVPGQERNRRLEELNWLEVGRVVPDSIRTVLVPVGGLEAHGVVNNGADITAPVAISERLAPRLNALVAPVIPYGVAGTIDEYPGTFGIRPSVFEEYAYETLSGLARTGFRHLVIVNGHGSNGPPLRRAAERVWRDTDARVIVLEWWTLTADLVTQVYGSEGGHAGNNETGAILAVRPDLVHADWYEGAGMTTPRGNGWTAYPFPSSILLYRAGEGYPDFDPDKAHRYFEGVVDRLEEIVRDVITKWERIDPS